MKRRSREEGGRQRQPKHLEDRGAACHLYNFLVGCILPCVRKTGYKNVALLRETKERLGMGTQEF